MTSSDRSSERLAPVSYLPWAAPDAGNEPTALETAREASREATRKAAVAAAQALHLDAADGYEAEPGDDGSAERLATGDDAVDAADVEAVLLRKLRSRSLSISEAEGVLKESGLDLDVAAEIIERFERIGYLDDARLAEQIVHTHHTRKGLGRSAVEAEMRRRGISSPQMAEVLDTLELDESAPATALAEKRLRSMRSLDDATAERRLVGFLLRKGYSSSVSRDAVRAAFAEAGRGAR